MMKSLISATALSFALTASAFAADLPYKKGPPIIPPPPPPTWTGFYAGLNAGGTWSDSNNTYTSGAGIFAAPTFSSEAAVAGLLATNWIPSGNQGGFIGGGQVGYNYQFGASFVAGLEADIQGVAGSSGNNTVVGALGVPGFPTETILSTTSVNRSLDYIGTVRGRVGWLFTPTLLVYGTGGLAYGGVNSTTTIFQGDNDTAGVVVGAVSLAQGRFSDTRVGWTAGGGVEWMFLPNWSAKVEYLFYDLGSINYVLSPLVANAAGFPQPTWVAFAQTRARFEGNIIRAGVNYHFNWGAPAPVLAKY